MNPLLEKYIAKVSEIPVQVDLGNRVFIDRSDIQSLLPELINEVREETRKEMIDNLKRDEGIEILRKWGLDSLADALTSLKEPNIK